MAGSKQTKGSCAFCSKEISKVGVQRHLDACAPYKEAIAAADRAPGRNLQLYHLRVEASGSREYWLDLEMRGSATVESLDDYLRAIWLDCCGHMSQFSFGGFAGDEISMRRWLSDVLPVGEALTHLYDYGTTSETLVKATAIREGKALTKHPITLLVRNSAPAATCIECERPATWLCNECIIEDEIWGTLCEEHARTHPHKSYGEPMPLLNSPRMGMCGYDGPAVPPY